MTDINHDEARGIARAWVGSIMTDIDDLARAYLDLAARNERLREALAPFALIAEHDLDSHAPNDALFRPLERHNRAARLKVGDLRRARQAYEEGGR